MHFGLVGINHKLADVNLREILAKTCQRRFGAGQSLHDGHFFVLLSTCNRTEIYFSSEDLAATHAYILSILRYDIRLDFDQKLYSYFGFDCFLHLTKVTAGLDSALLGETEIQGQVKLAYEGARKLLTLPKELHFLFQKALKTAKKVRVLYPLERGLPRIEEAFLKAVEETFCIDKSIKILMLGASEINNKILSHLVLKKYRDITLCNRSLKPALKIAKKQNLSLLPWNKLDQLVDYDLVICGTKAPGFLIQKELFIKNQQSLKLIIDLSLPRNVDPEIKNSTSINVLNIDEINLLVNDLTEKTYTKLRNIEQLVNQETKQQLITFNSGLENFELIFEEFYAAR